MIQHRTTQAGAVAVLVAVLAVVLFGMAALAVDLGSQWARKRELQASVDLAALAAAAKLPDYDEAIRAAELYLTNNWVNGQNRVWDLSTLDGAEPSRDPNGYLDIQEDPWRLTLYAPTAQVNYSFAPVLNLANGESDIPNHAHVSSQATVELRSPGDTLPLMLRSTPACSWGIQYLYTDAKDVCGRDGSSFGTMQNARRGTVGKGNLLRDNIALGLDHSLSAYPSDGVTGVCPLDTRTIKDDTVPADGANCVTPDGGGSYGQVRDGLLDRLGRYQTLEGCGPGGSSDELLLGSTPVNNDQLDCFLAPGVTAAQVSVASGAPKHVIDARIFESPRLFSVPVIGGEYPRMPDDAVIVEFRYVFLTELSPESDKVRQIKGVVINPDSMSETAASDESGWLYRGSGTKLLRLVG